MDMPGALSLFAIKMMKRRELLESTLKSSLGFWFFFSCRRLFSCVNEEWRRH